MQGNNTHTHFSLVLLVLLATATALAACSVEEGKEPVRDYATIPLGNDTDNSDTIRYEGVWKIDGETAETLKVEYVAKEQRILLLGFPYQQVHQKLFPEMGAVTIDPWAKVIPILIDIRGYSEDAVYVSIDVTDTIQTRTGKTRDAEEYRPAFFDIWYRTTQADGGEIKIVTLIIDTKESAITISQTGLSCTLYVKKVKRTEGVGVANTEKTLSPMMKLTFTSIRRIN